MAAADLSLREVEAQTKRRDLENAAFLQRVSREVLMARQQQQEEESRRSTMAQVDIRRKEQVNAAEAEMKRRRELEEIARREIAVRSMRNYQQYTWMEISVSVLFPHSSPSFPSLSLCLFISLLYFFLWYSVSLF